MPLQLFYFCDKAVVANKLSVQALLNLVYLLRSLLYGLDCTRNLI